MDRAKSMYLGGWMLSAEDAELEILTDPTRVITLENCTARLGLRCPECDEALKLRLSSQRTLSNGKILDVSPYFYHHRRTPETEECDKRVKQYGHREWQYLQDQQKAQRLELFNQKFVEIVIAGENILIAGSGNPPTTQSLFNPMRNVFHHRWLEMYTIFFRNELAKQLPTAYQVIASSLDIQVQKAALENDARKGLSSTVRKYVEQINNSLEGYLQKHSRRVQQAIAQEAVEFLANRTGGYSLRFMIIMALQSWYVSSKINFPGLTMLEFKEFVDENFEHKPNEITQTFLKGICDNLATNPWAAAINQVLGIEV